MSSSPIQTNSLVTQNTQADNNSTRNEANKASKSNQSKSEQDQLRASALRQDTVTLSGAAKAHQPAPNSETQSASSARTSGQTHDRKTQPQNSN